VVLLVLAPLLAIGLLVVLVVQARTLPSLFALLGGIYTLMCELRGTLVDVHGPDSRILISIS
jgi:hypothetical protein